MWQSHWLFLTGQVRLQAEYRKLWRPFGGANRAAASVSELEKPRILTYKITNILLNASEIKTDNNIKM